MLAVNSTVTIRFCVPYAPCRCRRCCRGGSGKNGKNSAGQKIYGQIHSPVRTIGNHLGAADHEGYRQSCRRQHCTYSSRGPTRSYWIDSSGRKRYDNLVKQTCLLRNKLVFAQSPLPAYSAGSFLDAESARVLIETDETKRTQWPRRLRRERRLMIQANPN